MAPPSLNHAYATSRISNVSAKPSIVSLPNYTIATILVHSELDYCNSLLLNIPSTQTNHLQLVLNYAARDVIRTPKFHHITPVLESLH